ncbi:MAG: glutamate synthase subunit beta [Proteobacteria bacterium]|nr:glutamate synthase subunit beta [Pseudomonadota bacterium]
MGKVTGFKEWPRALPDKRPVADRLRDWRELYQPQPRERVREQGGRCMDCGVPFCHQGCPLGNVIPEWNDLVYRGRWREAYLRLLCPAPCEGSCVLAINADAVSIEQIEKEIIERAFAEGWVQAQPPRTRSERSVAVVGSGPAGLAAAAQLNSAGHRVTVYEKAEQLGGLLRYGIPDFKLEKWVIDRRLALLEAEGVKFVTGAAIGERPTWRELRDTHDAVLIAIGAERPRELDVPGRELDGVHLAMDFLRLQNRAVGSDAPAASPLLATGKRVIILGGGDTGSDCLGTALRHGAASVQQIELLPAPPRSRDPGNPWPQWPVVWRSSTSHEEGGLRDFALQTKRLSGSDGKLSALHAVRVETVGQGEGGLRLVEQPGSELTLPVDLLILALGFVGPDTTALVDQLGVARDARGNVKIDRSFATNVEGVFAAGDAQRGASLIVWAIADGREAARAVDSYLREGAPSWLPTRGVDQPFGGR